MSNSVSSNGQENDKSSSPPSDDYEVFDYEEVCESFPYQRISSMGDEDDYEPEDGCGTPLNLELAQLLNQGIVSKTKANFGISKNIETLEKSTIELSNPTALNGSPRRKPRDLANATIYQRSPDLFLRRNDDEYSHIDDDVDEDVDFVRMKTNSRQPSETVFENGSGDPSPLCGEGAGGAFRFIEPTTSYHSAYGFDTEQMMFEGIP